MIILLVCLLVWMWLLGWLLAVWVLELVDDESTTGGERLILLLWPSLLTIAIALGGLQYIKITKPKPEPPEPERPTDLFKDWSLAPEPSPDSCTLAPEGWYCTREPGHDPPCAAWPSNDCSHKDATSAPPLTLGEG